MNTKLIIGIVIGIILIVSILSLVKNEEVDDSTYENLRKIDLETISGEELETYNTYVVPLTLEEYKIYDSLKTAYIAEDEITLNKLIMEYESQNAIMAYQKMKQFFVI